MIHHEQCFPPLRTGWMLVSVSLRLFVAEAGRSERGSDVTELMMGVADRLMLFS